jgi:3-hydroxy-9,10-secoandrosta-1,3,5(10)-triene-9,17-dione monooxygenase
MPQPGSQLTEVAEPAPTRAALVQAASDMVPTLRERSARCEELRMVPPETVAEIRAAGFARIGQPTRFGGMGLGVDVAAEVAMELARGCCSTGWVSALFSGHNFLVSQFGEQAQKEYWADSSDVLCTTASAMVRASCEEEPGGFRVSGHWRYSSGCDHAEWLILFMATGMYLLPKSDFRIEDDWYVMGLRGTGSKAVIVDDVFIPSHRMVPMSMLAVGKSPGLEMYPENPFHRLPMSILLTPGLLGPIVGMAKGLLELFDERVVKRLDLHTAKRACERPGTQLRFAEAAAAIDAADLIFRNNNEMLRSWGQPDHEVTMANRARIRRDVGYATKLCIHAADLLIESGDSSGLHDSQMLQRWNRDIHMAGVQFMATWDEPAMAFSQLHWGLDLQAHTI